MNNALLSRIKTYQWLILIVILGALLRLFHLEATGLWMDELHSSVGTNPDMTFGEVVEYCKKDQPPVYFLLLHGWFKMFQYNDFYGRLFSVLIGSLGILSMYFLGKEFKSSRVGLISAFLTMINYFHIDHSRQVRFYPLLFLLSSLSYLFFIRILKNKRPVDFILYILSTALILNTHFMGIAVFSSQFILFIIIIIWKKIRDIKFITYSLLSGVIVGLSFVHWLPIVFSELGVTQFWIEQAKWYFLVEYYWVYFRDITTCIICGILIILALREIFLRATSKSTTVEDVVLMGWIGFSILIPLIYSLIRTPMMQERYTFIIVPAVLLVVAFGFDAITMEKIKVYIIAILFFSFLENALFIKPLYFVRYPPQQYREVAKEVMKTDRYDQYVFGEYAWYFSYYFKIYNSVNPPLSQRYANFNELIVNANSVWILISTIFPDQGLSENQMKALESSFKLVEEKKFTDSIARHYVKR